MKLLKVRKTVKSIRIYLFGVRIIKYKNPHIPFYKIENRILDISNVQNVHTKTFEPYKNFYAGQEVVLVGSGPTLSQYQPINAVHIGVNRAFYWKKKPFDALFIQDNGIGNEILDQAIVYAEQNNTTLFLGMVDGLMISESVAIRGNAKRYYTDRIYQPDFSFTYNVCAQRLGDFQSVVFSAMQYLLWTNPKRIYLVGCDCNREGYFDSQQPNQLTENIIDNWLLLKEFAQIYYPETEIISVNPVGLKGMFPDITM